MKSERAKDKQRRIAVILDASGHSYAALELALAIAAGLKAEVEGVFVEDADLLRLAGLPFVREVRGATLNEEQVTEDRLQRELRGLARQARQSLESSASRHGVRWSFRVWRGSVQAEILAAALEAEMLTLAPLGSFAPLHRRPPPQPATPRPGELVVAVAFNNSDASSRALDAALKLARKKKAQLRVLLQHADTKQREKLRKKALNLLKGKLPNTTFLAVGSSITELAQAVLRSSGDVLVIDGENDLLEGRTVWQCVQAVHCPLLVVR